MTEDDLKKISEKMASSDCSPEDKLIFLKELNENMSGLFQDLNKLNSKRELDLTREDLNK